MRRAERGEVRVAVDRIACTGHGVCATVSGGGVELDEFGYPIPSQLTVSHPEARQLVLQCPARALRVVER